jgi:amino acid transporter
MRDLVLMIIGTVIGSGIFLVPGAVLRAVGNSVPLALTVWLAGGILSLLGAPKTLFGSNSICLVGGADHWPETKF